MTGTFDLDALKKRIRTGTFTPESQENMPFAAVAIIINPKDNGGSVLLIKRVERLSDPWSGQIAFPGGHKAQGDHDYLETAVREAGEEVGIDLQEHVLLGHLPVVRAHTQRIWVLPYVFELKANVPVGLNREISESFWAPLSSLKSMRVTETEVEVERGKLRVDAYVYDGRVIWGLTYRIINILLDRR